MDGKARVSGEAGSSGGESVELNSSPRAEHLEGWLADALREVSEMMHERGAKYGPGNIEQFGSYGVLVRLSDKLARLKHTSENFGDEATRESWLDVIGYGLIGLAWSDGNWPGSEANKPDPTNPMDTRVAPFDRVSDFDTD